MEAWTVGAWASPRAGLYASASRINGPPHRSEGRVGPARTAGAREAAGAVGTIRAARVAPMRAGLGPAATTRLTRTGTKPWNAPFPPAENRSRRSFRPRRRTERGRPAARSRGTSARDVRGPRTRRPSRVRTAPGPVDATAPCEARPAYTALGRRPPVTPGRRRPAAGSATGAGGRAWAGIPRAPAVRAAATSRSPRPG